jgi:hypothetical protein
VDVNYQAGTSEPVRADVPIVVGPKEKVIMLSPGTHLSEKWGLSTLREKEVGEFCTETKGPGQFSWLVLPIVTAL